jgi:multiple antibiotic resistance protein
MSFTAIAFSLFAVLNALGNIPLFVAMLGRYDIKLQRRVIIRELLIALFILLLFNFFGDDVLGFLGISQPIIGMAGGTLLFIIALGMIFPKIEHANVPRREPFIVPLAIPIVAGPGAIATVMVYSEQVQNDLLMTAAIFAAWLPTFLLLFASSNIKYLLGEKGLMACERLGGMLICLIAVKMFATGAFDFVMNSLAK